MQTIDEILQELQRIISDSVEANDYLSIFAWVYWRTTQRIQEGIQRGEFLDSAAMERFDVAFAKRYIDAYWQFRHNETPTTSWLVSFQARTQPLTIVQHLLLGMNAHIHFDLGLVAAEHATHSDLKTLETDFMKVNDILEELIDEVQNRVGRVSRIVIWIDRLGGQRDEALANSSIRISRQYAWHVARQLLQRSPEQRPQYIEQTDMHVARVGQRILAPPLRPLRWLLRIISRFEEKEVRQIIRHLEKI
jgi:hypothetical protein